MTQAHSRTVDTDVEVIEILVAISQVSARMARRLSVLAANHSEEGEKNYKQNDRKGYDDGRAHNCCRCHY